MEALPVFLDRVVPAWAAVVISMTAILILGEILPQAVCTGPNQLSIAVYALPLVNLLIVATFPVAYPIARVLDFIFGGHSDHLTSHRQKLKALVHLNRGCLIQQDSVSTTFDAEMDPDEACVIDGAIKLAEKSCHDLIVPFDAVFMLESSAVYDNDLLLTILKTGHSRIPVYQQERNCILGVVLVKTLLGVSSGGEFTMGQLVNSRRSVLYVTAETSVYYILNEFQKGISHLAFIVADAQELRNDSEGPYQLEGIITMEDIIEELIQEEIWDEFDMDESQRMVSKFSKFMRARPHSFRHTDESLRRPLMTERSPSQRAKINRGTAKLKHSASCAPTIFRQHVKDHIAALRNMSATSGGEHGKQEV
ncbi:MAG: uncharacterized protein KVP18_003748 [Porospora cf. gigantea A]|uniref:uncharacterized protein n=1 Tax=Porospora cf. gigantea A TaxID=2853593 RepID=UPI00355942CA|nr:MAG: hypothetical protein KVP18_003748 [Porospora cf. gigantea A]